MRNKLPAGWERIKFGTVVEHSAFGPRFSGDDYAEDGNVATLRTTDLDNDGRISYDSMPLARLNENNYASHLLQPGDLVITRSGTCGIAAVFDQFSLPVLPGAFLIRFRLNKNADSTFFKYYFNSPLGRSHILSVARGAVQQNLNITNIEALDVVLPPTAVQRSIIEVLCNYDSLIENNRRRMALLEESARLLYREWFVRLRFPGHEHSKIVDGIPAGWSRTTLGDVLTLKRGHDLPEQNRLEGEIPVVSSSGITGWHNAKKADPPGVVTGRYGTLGEVYYIDTEYWPLNTALYVSDFKEAEPLFAYYLLQAVLKAIQSDKAAVPGLNRNVVHAMLVLLPSVSMQTAFVEVVNPIRRMISKLVIQNEKLRGARDMLLPRLMSGEVKV